MSPGLPTGSDGTAGVERCLALPGAASLEGAVRQAPPAWAMVSAAAPSLLRRRPSGVGAAALLGLLTLALAAQWMQDGPHQHACKPAVHARGVGSQPAGQRRRGMVYLRYTAGNGLCNQLNAHINVSRGGPTGSSAPSCVPAAWLTLGHPRSALGPHSPWPGFAQRVGQLEGSCSA